MKLFGMILPLAVASAMFVSCNKDGGSVEPQAKGEIVFDFSNSFEASVTTKATPINAVPSSLFWCATTGTRGNSAEAKKWDMNAATAKAVSANKLATGQYQTATPTAYNYYVANLALTAPATGNVTMTVPNNNIDAIAGWVASSSSSAPAINLQHVFARTGTLTMAAQDGYEISNVSWKIVGTGAINGTAGVFNLSTGSWASASTKLTTKTDITSSSDFYYLPGGYSLECTYTLTKGGYTQTFTKSATVDLVMGKINHIKGKASGGSATEITLEITLEDWGEVDHNLSFS